MEADLRIGETHVTVVKGSNAIQLDKNLLFNLVADAFSDQNWADIHYDGGADAEQKLDVESLYDAVYAEPANAEYDPETGMATPHVTGRSFDLALARQLWSAAEPGELVSIPLILEEPEVTTDSLNDLLFSDLLGQKSTSLGGSSNARINNIQKAALAIDGLILNPGEEFSYNEALGERTAENGYQPAGAYSGGKVVTEYGGGICQVSSTLYYVALLANLEITDRTCHYFGVGYLPAGLDATVSWGGPEFKFRNNREFPVRIEAYTDMEAYTVVVKIWGTDVDGSYVELSAYTWPTDDGYGAQSYRLVYAADGTLISQEPEARSIYHYEKEEEEEEEEDPEATESPEPSESPIPTEAPEPSAEPSPSEEPTPPAEPPVEPLPEYPVEPPVEPTPPTEEPPAEPVPTPEESYPAEPVPTPEESYPAEPVPTPGESYPAEPFTPSAAPEESHPAEEYPAEPFTPGGAPEPTQPVEPPADENAV